MSGREFEHLISPAELAEALGMSLGWVRDHWQAGDLPGFVIDRRVRFRLSEVELWLDERRRGPRPPLRATR
jgi:predicted DNA-binding transcriptional regulator AlpA